MNPKFSGNFISEVEKREKTIKEIKVLTTDLVNAKLNNLKLGTIRNLKITGNIAKLLWPFIVTGAIIVGISTFSGKYMFHKDDVIKYQKYTKTIDSFGTELPLETTYEGEYDSRTFIEVYSNWKLNPENNLYEQKITKYKVVNLYDTDAPIEEKVVAVRNAIKKNGFDIYEHLRVVSEQIISQPKELINANESNLNDTYYIRATINGINYNKYEVFKETDADDIALSMLAVLGYLLLLSVLLIFQISGGEDPILSCKSDINNAIEKCRRERVNVKRIKKQILSKMDLI